MPIGLVGAWWVAGALHTRMLCHDVGLMDPVARLMWRVCRVDGRPSRYRGEPPRSHLPTRAAAG